MFKVSLKSPSRIDIFDRSRPPWLLAATWALHIAGSPSSDTPQRMSADPEQEVFFGSRSSSRKTNGLGRLNPQNPPIYELITSAAGAPVGFSWWRLLFLCLSICRCAAVGRCRGRGIAGALFGRYEAPQIPIRRLLGLWQSLGIACIGKSNKFCSRGCDCGSTTSGTAQIQALQDFPQATETLSHSRLTDTTVVAVRHGRLLVAYAWVMPYIFDRGMQV